MGGGLYSKPEHLLVILPFKVPTEIFDRITTNHPNIKITFKNTLFTTTPWKSEEDIPQGLHALPPTTFSSSSQALAVMHDY